MIDESLNRRSNDAVVFVRRFTGFDSSIVVGNDCVDSSDDVRLIVLNKLGEETVR